MKCPNCHADNTDTARFCSNCATPLTSADGAPPPFTKTMETPISELARGTLFAGRYEIIEELGRGGMGAVYRVEDTKAKEEIALKLIRPEIAADKKTIERFRNELKTARKIRHNNICGMYDLAEEKGAYFITMEYVPGQDLKGLIQQTGRLAISTSISIAKQICKGLSEAHRLDIVHRDLKPSNIMIDKTGNVRIMDFGIARSGDASEVTGTGVVIGTPQYMSPEQAEAEDLDPRSDIYSLGIIIYEMVTGQVPFKGKSGLSIAMKQKGELPQNPQEINPQVPDKLGRLILKCLEKDKDLRYQSTEELSDGLDEIEKALPTRRGEAPGRKTTSSKEITVSFTPKKLIWPVLAIAALVMAALVITKLFRKEEIANVPSGKPSLAVVYFKNNTGQGDLEHWREAIADLLIADLSQSKYIRVLSRDRLFDILRHLGLVDAEDFTSQDLREIAVRGGARYVLQGAYAKAGDKFRINYTLSDPNIGDQLKSEMLEGETEESIFLMVDDITRQIKEQLELTAEELASDIDRDVSSIAASSPEAYKYYSAGIKKYNKGEYRDSIEFMERALALDPEFAMAYRSLALSYDNLKSRDLSRTYLQKALEFRDRLSERERLLIQGTLYQKSSQDYTLAVETFLELLKLYPDDLNANLRLAIVYRGQESWDKAIALCERNIENRDDNALTYIEVSRAYGAKGYYDKAQEHLEYYLSEISDSCPIRLELATTLLCQGKTDMAEREILRAEELDPDYFENYLDEGHLHIIKGELHPAENSYRRILDLEDKGQHLSAFSWLGSLYSVQGKYAKAIDQFERGLELSQELGETGSASGFYTRLAYIYLFSGEPEKALNESLKAETSSKEERGCLMCHQNWALLYKGLAQTKTNALTEAKKTAEELKAVTERGMGVKYMRLYHHLRGTIALDEGDSSIAIQDFSKAIDLLPHQHTMANLNDQALFMEARARAFYIEGDMEKAQEDYEQIIAFTVGRLHWGDIYARSFYMLGRIFEEKGWPGKAIEKYDYFLDLWKDADPGKAEVEDARERLARLKNLPQARLN